MSRYVNSSSFNSTQACSSVRKSKGDLFQRLWVQFQTLLVTVFLHLCESPIQMPRADTQGLVAQSMVKR